VSICVVLLGIGHNGNPNPGWGQRTRLANNCHSLYRRVTRAKLHHKPKIEGRNVMNRRKGSDAISPFCHTCPPGSKGYGGLGTRLPNFGSFLMQCLPSRFLTSNCNSILRIRKYCTTAIGTIPAKYNIILPSINVCVYFGDSHTLSSSSLVVSTFVIESTNSTMNLVFDSPGFKVRPVR
jgi:hypothetical protein